MFDYDLVRFDLIQLEVLILSVVAISNLVWDFTCGST